jgi:spermidine/putrescine transport system ATP-binding protein
MIFFAAEGIDERGTQASPLRGCGQQASDAETRTMAQIVVSEPLTVRGVDRASGRSSIELRDVSKLFGEVLAVNGVSLDVRQGEFLTLLGPSGCGKTTTLRMIGGFEEATSGRIFLGDRDVVGLPPYKRDVNTVFQSYALFPHMTVADNVAFGLHRKRLPKGEVKTRVAEILELVDLAGREGRKPRELSGGQQQRVALARAIVNNPRVLLLDEPLGALDLKLRKQMQLELKRIQNEVGITFVHVTHDQEEAMTMADTIAVMNGGRIEQLGTPSELYERPRTAFVAGFLGKSNLLEGTITGDGVVRLVDGSELRASTNGSRGRVSVGVRPEKISLRDGGVNRLSGKVKESAYIGVATEVVVKTPVGEMTVFHQNVEAGGVAPAPGSQVTLSWAPEATFVVDRGEEQSV